MPFSIRPAQPEDAPVITALINELADYEKLSHESRPDPSSLAEHLAADASPRTEVYLAVDTDTSETIGFALFFQNYSTFLTQWGIYMEDLYVRPAYRSRGVGRALVEQIARTAVARRCGRLEWSVLNWNDTAIEFYKRIGATPMREWTGWRLSGAALQDLGGYQPGGGGLSWD